MNIFNVHFKWTFVIYIGIICYLHWEDKRRLRQNKTKTREDKTETRQD